MELVKLSQQMRKCNNNVNNFLGLPVEKRNSSELFALVKKMCSLKMK